MARAIWKGFITFGLVLIPVEVYGAEAPGAQLDLDMLDARDGARIRYQRVNERTGKEVEWADIAKGYKLDDGTYVMVEPEDFKRAAADVTRGIEIVEFVDRTEITPEYFEKPYLVMPGKGGEKVYALLRDVLERSKRVGLAKTVLHTRQHLGVLMPHADGETLLLITVRFPEELRGPKDVEPEGGRGTPKISAREIALANTLVDQMSTAWQPAKFRDEYQAALRKFIEEKARNGGKVTRPKEKPAAVATATPDIMELLRKSLAGHAAGRGTGAANGVKGGGQESHRKGGRAGAKPAPEAASGPARTTRTHRSKRTRSR